MKKEKGTFGWVFTFAGQKKSGYIASVIFAVIGAVFQILPFFVMAQAIGKLLAGNRELSGYLIDCADGGVLALACTVPLAVYGAVSQGDLRRAGKHPQAGA